MPYQYQIRLLGPIGRDGETGLAERAEPTQWVTVSKEEFMQAEKVAGCISQHPGQPATHYFSGRNIEGKTVYVKENTDG